MNPLTLVKRIQSINAKEATLGISEEASWHAKYKDSAYVYVGGVPFDLTEGDILSIFSQYGEVVDVNLVRDKGTGKSKGFAFLAYEDQRSTILAVDNLNGAQVCGRTIRVDHVTNYKKKEEEDEETAQQKREARGVCRAFQRGECTRGAGCKFSHDEQRAANTGWGAEDNRNSKWGHDRFDAPKKTEKRHGNIPPFLEPEPSSRAKTNERALENNRKNGDKTVDKRSGRYNDDEFEPKSREDRSRVEEKRSRRHDDDDLEPRLREGHDGRDDKRSRRRDEYEPKLTEDRTRELGRPRRGNDDDLELKPREDYDRREQTKSRRHGDHIAQRKSPEDRDGREGKRPRRPESESYTREDRDKRGGDKRSAHDRSESKSYTREDRDKRGGDKRSAHDRDFISHQHRER